MAAPNTQPIFAVEGDVSNNDGTGMNQAITLAANDYTGAGANNSLVFTAGANGAYVKGLWLKPAGTNVASALRAFVNNGSANTTAANNSFLDDISLPATTASAVLGTVLLYMPIERAIPAGFRIYVGLATAVAAGWVVTPEAGQY